MNIHLKRLEQINKKTNQFAQFLTECKTTHQLLSQRKKQIQKANKKHSNRYNRTSSNFSNDKSKNYQYEDDVLYSYNHLSQQKQFLNNKIKKELDKICAKNQTKKITDAKKQGSLTNKNSQTKFRNQSLELNKKIVDFENQNTSNLSNPQEELLKVQPINKIKKQTFQESQKRMVSFQTVLLNLKLENLKKYLKLNKNKVNKNSPQTQISQFVIKLSQVSNFSFLNNQPFIKKYSNCVYFGTNKNQNNFHFGLQYYFESQTLFIGCMKNFKKHGQGIQFLKLQETQIDFIIYQGTFVKGIKTGNFMINYPDSIYNGPLINGKFQGQGCLTTKISTFKGIFSENKKKYGQQSFIKSGMKYQGQFKDNIFNGNGTLKTDKILYKGQFVDGQKQGRGLQVTQQYIYEGFFKKDKKNGAGMLFQKGKNKNQNNIKFVIFEEDQIIQISNQQMHPQEQQNQQSFESLKQSSLKSFHEQISEKTQLEHSYYQQKKLSPLKLPSKEKLETIQLKQQIKIKKQKGSTPYKYLEGHNF